MFLNCFGLTSFLSIENVATSENQKIVFKFFMMSRFIIKKNKGGSE